MVVKLFGPVSSFKPSKPKEFQFFFNSDSYLARNFKSNRSIRIENERPGQLSKTLNFNLVSLPVYRENIFFIL